MENGQGTKITQSAVYILQRRKNLPVWKTVNKNL